MPLFKYRVITESGAALEDEVYADGIDLLRSELEGKGYFILKIRQADAAKGFDIARLPVFKGMGIKGSDLIVFNQELLALIKAGLPILQCLDIVIERVGNARLGDILSKAREDVRGGSHLSESLARHPQIPRLYTAFLKVGETSGNLIEVIQRYINYLKIVENIRQKVINALIYPAILLVVVTAVVVFLLAYAVPAFAEIYKDFSSQLPRATVLLMGVTSFIKANIIVISLLILVLSVALKMWAKTPSGRLIVWDFVLRIPLIKDIINRYFISQIARTLALVLGGGIPLLASMEIVRDSVTNPLLAEKVKRAMTKIKEGSSLASAFESEGVMESLPTQMVHVGESTGSLEEMLKAIADLYDEEISISVARMTVLIEPMLMLCMGVIVGAIVLIMYLPVFYMGGAR